MGKRNTGRKLAMQALYQAEIREDSMAEILEDSLEQSEYMPETKDWAISLAKQTWAHRDTLDPIITRLAIGWEFSRINPIDKSLLRMAFYEMIFMKTDPGIVLNEAIEIAKKYSTDDSPKFLNGILGKYVETECSQD